jgi:hypothetical protein
MNKASSDEREQICRETVTRFGAAWAAGDVDGLMREMSDEPIYRGSTGPEPGTIIVGSEQVRAAFERIAGPNARSAPATPAPPPEMYFFEDRALAFWRLKFPGSDSEVEGVDVMTFTNDGRISVKDAYRKAFS